MRGLERVVFFISKDLLLYSLFKVAERGYCCLGYFEMNVSLIFGYFIL